MSHGDVLYLLATFAWGVAFGMVVEQARERRQQERELVRMAEAWLARRLGGLRSDYPA